MHTLDEKLTGLYEALLEAFGHRSWWPARTAWEMMVGAILTQNTNWKNVERALDGLKRAGALDASVMVSLPEEQLQGLVRPAGYFRQKTSRLRRLAEWWLDEMDGSAEALAACGTDTLRESLLALKGIGRETADSIVLYAAGKPSFVIDAYTARVCVRHGLIDPDASYEDLKALFEDHVPRDAELYKDYHAQIVELGKRFCRKRPLCEHCPARGSLGEPIAEFV